MSKKDRMAVKNEKITAKKAEKSRIKSKRINAAKIFGTVICCGMILLLCGILYVTADYRAQKSVIDNYMSAVKLMDYDKMMSSCDSYTVQALDDYSDDVDFKEFYIDSRLGYLKNLYGDDFGMKYKILSRYDYSTFLRENERIIADAVIVDANVTYYNDETSDKQQNTFILIKENGKWLVHSSNIEAASTGNSDIVTEYEKIKELSE